MKIIGLLLAGVLFLFGCTALDESADKAKEKITDTIQKHTDPTNDKLTQPAKKSEQKPEFDFSKPIVVGVQKGADMLSFKITDELLKNAGFEHVAYVQTKNLEHSFEKLKNGTIDIALDLKIGDAGHSVSYTIPYMYDYPEQELHAFAVRKDSPLDRFLIEQIKSFEETDEYESILANGVKMKETERLLNSMEHLAASQ